MLTNIAHYYYHHSCYYYYYHYCYYNNIYYYHYYYTILTHKLPLLLPLLLLPPPLPQSAAEMTESLDIDCAMNLLAKQATEIAQKTGTHPIRDYILIVVVCMYAVYIETIYNVL